MILDKVVQHHGSTSAFNSALKRQLLLEPLSYKVDLEELNRRSVGTRWDFSRIETWLSEVGGEP